MMSEYPGWTRLESFKCEGIPISKWKSETTGLRVALAEVEGPLVFGYFALATEAFDDFGLPHTLEHAIFLGSELYPYKGVLDSLANRCLAQGTNAWTDVDHTCYTIEVAGSEGFLNILPIYLDHVLYPTLTDSGFYTEVHHINGEGADAGVVYSEMQARENTGRSIMHRKLVELLYPGHCGYKSETGGMLAPLRDLTANQVRQYHKEFYRMDNLCLIVTGKVPLSDFFNALKPVEARVVSKGELPPLVRPWSTPVPPFENIADIDITFPSDDEEVGSAVVGWRGPHYENFEEATALRVLWKYLTDSSVSPLRKAFVDIPEPFCTQLAASFAENSVFIQYLRFESAPTAKLGQLKDKLFEELNRIMNEGIDMHRMKTVIQRMHLRYLSTLETRPHDKLAFSFIGDFLYGQAGQLQSCFSEGERYQSLLEKDDKFWLSLLKANLLDQPFVFIRGHPSKDHAKKLADDEAARVAAQREKLGEEKLKKLEEELEAAIDANEVEIPTSELEKIPIPDASKISFIPVTTVRNHRPLPPIETERALEKHLRTAGDAEGKEKPFPPFFIQFDNIPSLFVEVTAFIDTGKLPEDLRPYIPLFREAMFEVSIKTEDGKVIDHEDVVKLLTEQTVAYANDIGFDGGSFSAGKFAQLITVNFKSEVSKYEGTVEWLKNILWNTNFTKDRLEIAAQKLINDVASHKREGMEMTAADSRATNFDPKMSNHPVVNLVKQFNFLSNVVKRLQDETQAEQVCAEVAKFREILCDPSNIRIQVAANFFDRFTKQNPLKPWVENFLPKHLKATETSYVDSLSEVKFSHEFLTDTAKNPQAQKVVNVLSLAAIESSYLSQSAPGPSSYNDTDLYALHVLVEYLTTMEGPFWKQLRGQGLAYSYSIRIRVEQGLLYFILFKSVSIVKAYEEALKIIQSFATKETPFEPTGLDAARSSVIYNVISREDTAPSAAGQAFVNYLAFAGRDDNKRILEGVKAVTLEDLHRVLVKYFVILFDPQQANISVATNPSNVDDLKKYFEEKHGKKVTVVTSLDDHFARL